MQSNHHYQKCNFEGKKNMYLRFFIKCRSLSQNSKYYESLRMETL